MTRSYLPAKEKREIFDALKTEGRQARLEQLEKEMLKLPQAPCPVTHSFGPGIYVREVRIPAGVRAVGHWQNFDHLNIMIKGRVTMHNDDGTHTELVAPQIFVGQPGRKIGTIHEDMVWLNIYATDETDIEKLEAFYLTKSEGWTETIKAKEQLTMITTDVDQRDYQAVLTEFGFTEAIARAQSENLSDQTALPFGSYKIKVAMSRIEGKGLFATGDIKAGDLIAPARITGKRTPAGRFTNHSATPNARMVRAPGGGDINLVATRTILGCHGGMDGEEITINYREALSLTLEIGQEKKCLE